MPIQTIVPLAAILVGGIVATIHFYRKKVKTDTDLNIIAGRVAKILYEIEHPGRIT